MIISVSRRTDIPAYFSNWFINRIQQGFVYVRNPMNFHQVSRVSLNPDLVDCIVFWSKNPEPLINKLDKIKDYNYYFQFTLTPYDETIEENLPSKEKVIETFIKLSETIGKHRVIWRYDPIILTDKLSIEYHKEKFQYLAERLNKYTDKCVISFLDSCRSTEKNIHFRNITEKDMIQIGAAFSKTAEKYNIKIESCAEKINLQSYGINHGKCIDDKLISKIINEQITVEKDKNQREHCGCVKSIDIGMYNTCMNYCNYCYANYNKTAVKGNFVKHNVNSPFLIGELMSEDKVTERKMECYRNKHLKQGGQINVGY